MSLLKAVKSVFGGGSSSSGGGDRLYLVDGERMLDSRDVGPGERAALLQRLARFVEREKIRMSVVFGGRPLREVEHGGEFQGIKVFYIESREAYAEQYVQTVKDALRRDKVCAITNDAETEKKIVDLGGTTIRCSTLRKGLEGGGEGGERGGPGGDRGGDFRGGGDRGPRRRRGPRGGRGPGGPRDGRPPQGGGEGGSSEQAGDSNPGDSQGGQSSSVKNLIDLVE